jgi:hypothetical protein
MEFEYDPGKDASNQTKHGLSLAAGEALFADPDRLILPSIRKIEGEERFKVWPAGRTSCTRRCSSGVTVGSGSSRSGEAMMAKNVHTIPADPDDPEDFAVGAEALERAQRSRLVRQVRHALGLSQAAFAARFGVPVGTPARLGTGTGDAAGLCGGVYAADPRSPRHGRAGRGLIACPIACPAAAPFTPDPNARHRLPPPRRGCGRGRPGTSPASR